MHRESAAFAATESALAAPISTDDLPAFRRSLLRWFDAHQRDLPWRRTRDPYRIWLSEVLLQQTRVEAVRAYYERFITTFPSVTALANAEVDEVLRLWAGLGYYSRARNLHAAAQAMRDDHAGAVPRTAEALRALPGVGRYTAAAVASIAFGQPAAALDGNIKRVLARLFAIDAPIDVPATTELLWRLADSTLARRRPGDFNQAMMELGATVCTPRSPACEKCPVRRHCTAFAHGLQHTLPRKLPKRVVPLVIAGAAAIHRGDQLLVVQRPRRGLLGGLWELPAAEFPADTAGAPNAAALRAALLRDFGVRVGSLAACGVVEHQFTHRLRRTSVFRGEFRDGCVAPVVHAAARWIRGDELSQLAWSTMDRKILASAGYAEW